MEKKTYDYFKREHDLSYLMRHVEILLEEATTNESISSVIYACLECRNILEKIEFNLILMSTEEAEWSKIEEMAKGKSGIQKTNNEYKILRYRYQTFSEAISRVSDLPVKAFDFKGSEQLQKRLSEYLHIYTKAPSDMSFYSEFIQKGIQAVKDTLDFVHNFFVKDEQGYSFGVLNFHTLNGSFKSEFDSWKKDVTEDTEGLYNRLKKINDEEFGGAKAKPVE